MTHGKVAQTPSELLELRIKFQSESNQSSQSNQRYSFKNQPDKTSRLLPPQCTAQLEARPIRGLKSTVRCRRQPLELALTKSVLGPE